MMTTEAPEGIAEDSGKNRWFQLGLISAGTMAPLIARWRNLRAAEQAEAVREQASSRWSDAVDWLGDRLPQDALPDNLRQAIPQAQEKLRQAGPVALKTLRRMPIPLANSAADAVAPVIAPPRSNRKVSVALWTLGVSVGLVAAGATAYVMLRNRLNASADDAVIVEIPLTTPMTAESLANSGPIAAATESPAVVQESPEEEPRIAEPPTFGDLDAEGAAFVGNIASRVYHPIDSKQMPSPEHRIYFSSAEQAMKAGYRPEGAQV
jgi:hypothetical protein